MESGTAGRRQHGLTEIAPRLGGRDDALLPTGSDFRGAKSWIEKAAGDPTASVHAPDPSTDGARQWIFTVLMQHGQVQQML